MSGAVAFKPDKNATDSIASTMMERNLLRLFLISLIKSFRMAETTVRLLSVYPTAQKGKQRVEKAFSPQWFFNSLNSFLSYHSIFSTGVGLALNSSDSTVPFLMWMTWSAMGVMAVLWVMTTTVTPFSRQVSCSSFKMALPVT